MTKQRESQIESEKAAAGTSPAPPALRNDADSLPESKSPGRLPRGGQSVPRHGKRSHGIAHVIDWHKPVTTLIALIGLILALAGTVANMVFSYFGLRGLQTQLRFQRETQQQSVPVDFRLVPQIASPEHGLLMFKNAGAARLVSIEASVRFYFAFPSGRVMTVAALENMLQSDPVSLERCREAKLVVVPRDVRNLVEPSRRFSVSWIGASASHDGSDEFRPEISPSSVQNALRLAHVLQARVVVRCQVDYQHQVSRQLFNRKLYILLQPTFEGDALKVRPRAALDLHKTIGGPAIIDAIAKYEEATQEVIFEGRQSYGVGESSKP